MTVCRKCRVAGRVQGVFFRASTQQRAQQLALTGYARNMDDGSVEVLVCGDSAQVEQLCRWLWQGPQAAEVAHVECREVVQDAPAGFHTS